MSRPSKAAAPRSVSGSRRTASAQSPQGAGADAEETAKFVAEFTTELSSLARRARFDLLAYLLDMARLEAIRIVQSRHREP